MQQLARLQAGLSRPAAQLVAGDRRAVVACLLRRRRQSVDMFFILRAAADAAARGPSSSSRWGGQVGFPGGHVEGSETDHEAVARECEEEVGLSLDSPGAYRFMGCVRDRAVPRMSPDGPRLVVGCRVYEQLVDERPRLDAREVAACGWAPLATLLPEGCAVSLEQSGIRGLAPSSRWGAFPSVPLPVSDLDVSGDDLEEEFARAQFVLWGLTMTIVSDLLVSSGLRSGPIALSAAASAGAAPPTYELLEKAGGAEPRRKPGIPLPGVLQTGVFRIAEMCLALTRKLVFRDH